MTSKLSRHLCRVGGRPGSVLGRCGPRPSTGSRPFERVFDPDAAVYGRWFTGGTTNTCYNCLDRHVAKGRGDQPAVIYDSPITGAKKIYSYAEFLSEVKALAAVLQDRGVSKGDRVIIYMPMIPEAPMAMLACARLGAVHSVVFGGFAGSELATRIDDAKPKLIIARPPAASSPTASSPTSRCSTKPSTRRTHKPDACLMLQTRAAPGGADRGPRRRSGRCHGGRPDRSARRALHAGGGDRSPLYSLHVRHHRPAEGRGARQWRSYGGAQLVDEGDLRHGSGRGLLGGVPMSAGWSATPTSSTRRCCTATPPSCSKASRSARPMPAPSGG